MSPTTDTFERDLSALLHSAVDGTHVPLGVHTDHLVDTATHAYRRRNTVRAIGGAAAACLLASGVWVGLSHHGDNNLRPSGPPTTAIMVIDGTPVGGATGFANRPIVVADRRQITLLDGSSVAPRVLGRLPIDTTQFWVESSVDPRIRWGVLPLGTTMPIGWPTQLATSTAVTQLEDGRYVVALSFSTAADARGSDAIRFQDDGTVVTPTGDRLPAVTLTGPNLAVPGDAVTRTVFVDSAGHRFGVHWGLMGGQLGPRAVAGPLQPVSIGADGAGAFRWSIDVPAQADNQVDVTGVVPAAATQLQLVGPHGAIAVQIRTAPIPGTKSLAFWAQQYKLHGTVPLAEVTAVTWTDPATGRSYSHEVPPSVR